MCSRPITQNNLTFACRSCDQCIATRRHDWVARAMAEKTDWPHALCVALTYSDETDIGYQGARMFCYADVRAFFARLRAAAKRVDPKAVIRFLCAGEQGDRNGRCHWHLILYSNIDLRQLGDVHHVGNLLTSVPLMMSEGKRKRRLNWSLWPLGFVTFQIPDEGGMKYVLSYCLKDQFTGEKSKGTMREAGSENFATGLFRMSKRPAIGEAFLMRKMAALDASRSVLPALNISIPDFKGYWQPSGNFRKKLLWCLVALNRRNVWSTGGNAPQWASLLASCVDNETDLEILNGKPQEQDPISFDSEIHNRERQYADFKHRADTARKCGSIIPCHACLHELDRFELQSLGIQRFEGDEGNWVYHSIVGLAPIDERRKETLGRINPYCQSKGSKGSNLVFPRSDPKRS